MRFPLLTSLATALCLALPATAQKVQVFGGNGERASSSQILFGPGIMAGMAVNYSQPTWKESHNELMDSLKGKLLRLGKDWWTTFNTSVDVEFGGVKVPKGSYLLGLSCDKEGKFSLALLDAAKALKAGAAPWPLDDQGTMNWKPDILAPMELHKDVADTSVTKMTMTLKANAEDLADGSFTIAWGKHELRTKLAVLAGTK